MKLITFADGNTIQATDTSTMLKAVFVVKSFDLVEDIRNMFTEENMKKCSCGEQNFENIIPVSCKAIAQSGENVTVTIVNKRGL